MVESDAPGCHLVNVRRDDLIVAVATQHVRRLLVAEHENEVRLWGQIAPARSCQCEKHNHGKDRCFVKYADKYLHMLSFRFFPGQEHLIQLLYCKDLSGIEISGSCIIQKAFQHLLL